MAIALVWLLTASAQVSSLQGKRMGVIGDSYVKNHREPVENTWHYKFARQNGMEYYNYGRNGNCVSIDRARWGEAMWKRYTTMRDSLDIIVIIALSFRTILPQSSSLRIFCSSIPRLNSDFCARDWPPLSWNAYP